MKNIFIDFKIKYNKITNYLFNKALFYFDFGYKEAKILLFLYCLLKLNLKIYKEEKEVFYSRIRENNIKFFSGRNTIIYVYRSRVVEIIFSYFKYLKYYMIFSNNIFINFLLAPYFKYKKYQRNKYIIKLVNQNNNYKKITLTL